ncbi:preprotein translocase subunit SecG [uncultured Sulfitobacter sp.]|uniref:preprotein translocase subunit SecG n=1 Tax=uncultured Sulfitobacter sp. TaxID=191468 RepID=UPI00262B1D12|nr:preprotein translocase subunit SecG [uncultured Sulfitobacter sp.]
MENVLLIIHLFLAMGLILAVLLQRSEGGGLGIGGGGGGNAGRAPQSAMGKLTWLLGAAFIVTSISLTIIVARNTAGASVIDRLSDAPVTAPVGDSSTPSGESLLPPTADDNAPLVPAGE